MTKIRYLVLQLLELCCTELRIKGSHVADELSGQHLSVTQQLFLFVVLRLEDPQKAYPESGLGDGGEPLGGELRDGYDIDETLHQSNGARRGEVRPRPQLRNIHAM